MSTNGRLTSAELDTLPDGTRLRADAAESLLRLAARFQDELGRDFDVTDGYRPVTGTKWSQTAIFLDRYTPTYTEYAPGKVDRRVYNGRAYYRRPGTDAAAVPGTSNHGWGVAVDLASGINTSFTSPEHKWMAKHAPAYGWTNTEGRSINEPWHWVYDPATDQHKGDPVKISLSSEDVKRIANAVWAAEFQPAESKVADVKIPAETAGVRLRNTRLHAAETAVQTRKK